MAAITTLFQDLMDVRRCLKLRHSRFGGNSRPHALQQHKDNSKSKPKLSDDLHPSVPPSCFLTDSRVLPCLVPTDPGPGCFRQSFPDCWAVSKRRAPESSGGSGLNQSA